MKLSPATLSVFALVLAPTALATLWAAPAHAQGATTTPPAPAAQYLKVAPSGAKLRNLASTAGEIVLDAPPGTLLAVRGERSGWLEVEPATGFKAWVFGAYLKKTSTPGIAEVNANSVRMRPLPSSDEKSFPLPTKLDRGERVRVLARADSSKPLAEDWIQVASPAGATAWILAGETQAIPASEDARAAWATAVKGAQESLATVDAFGAATAKDASAPAPGAATAAKPDAKPASPDEIAQAETLFRAAQASPTPDYAAAKKAYEAVIARAPESAAASSARSRLEEISIREEIVRLKSDKDRLEGERSGKLAEAEARLKEVAVSQDPLWGRFQARGWLERRTQAGLPPHFAVTWGGREVAEVVCGNGRYELDSFVGCEVGIVGVTKRAAVPASAGGTGTPARIDATKIEVLSARGGG